MSDLPWRGKVLFSAVIFLVAAVVFGFSLQSSYSVEPAIEPRAARPVEPWEWDLARRTLPESMLSEAVDTDPFHPERRRASFPFRLPGEVEPVREIQSPQPVESKEELRLVGTAVLPGGRNFVLCIWPGESLRLLRVGESTRHLKLKEVSQRKAVFVADDGSTIELLVPKAGA